MFKTLFVAIWTAALLSGSAWFFGTATEMTEAEKMESETGYFGGLEYIDLGTQNITMIRNNEIQGYLLLEVVFTISKAEIPTLSVPIEYLLRDMVIRASSENKDINLYKLSSFDLDAFQKELGDRVNEKLGKKTVHEVLVQKVDFLSVDAVRDLQLRRN